MLVNHIVEKKFAKQIVIVRADFNVPMKNGRVLDDSRILQAKPTIDKLLDDGAVVLLLSHFGRPSSVNDQQYSLRHILPAVNNALGHRVKLLPTIAEAKDMLSNAKPGSLYLLENIRYFPGEKDNDPELFNQLAEIADVYVNDAFSVCHRRHASVAGLAEKLKSYAGLALINDIDNLTRLFNQAQHPLTAIVGGAKVSTKIEVLDGLLHKADTIFVGGGMANTFLKAQGYPIGNSLIEPAYIKLAEKIIKQSQAAGCELIFPSDVIVTKDIAAGVGEQVTVNQVTTDDIIVDVGEFTLQEMSVILGNSKSVIWNGPLGVYETPPFNAGTQCLARMIAELTKSGQLQSLVGGGDSIAALQDCDLLDDISYACTAGGAFLEWLAGRDLPGLIALENYR